MRKIYSIYEAIYTFDSKEAYLHWQMRNRKPHLEKKGKIHIELR